MSHQWYAWALHLANSRFGVILALLIVGIAVIVFHAVATKFGWGGDFIQTDRVYQMRKDKIKNRPPT